VKIEEYLRLLPNSIMTGEDVELRNDVLREIFRFASLSTNDIFYHLGCGNGGGVVIALQEFGVKKAVGIDNNTKKISCAKRTLEEKNLYNGSFRCEDIFHSDINDASVILFWFTDEHIIEKMIPKFSQLKNGSRIITIWGPLTSCLQMLAVFETDCIDFVVAWELAERYSKAIGPKEVGNDRFLTILQSLAIWINAKNLGIACGDEIPQPVKNYMGILRTFFNIEMEHLLNQKSS